MSFFEVFQLIEDVAEDELDDFNILSVCCPFEALLNCPKKALLLVITCCCWVEFFDILQSAVEHFKMIQALQCVRMR